MHHTADLFRPSVCVIVPPAMEVELFIHTSAITPEHLAVNITYAINPECVLLLPVSFYFSIFI